jgi:hypothetical protein
MWCVSFRAIAVAGAPSEDASDDVRHLDLRPGVGERPRLTGVVADLTGERPRDHRVRDREDFLRLVFAVRGDLHEREPVRLADRAAVVHAGDPDGAGQLAQHPRGGERVLTGALRAALHAAAVQEPAVLVDGVPEDQEPALTGREPPRRAVQVMHEVRLGPPDHAGAERRRQRRHPVGVIPRERRVTRPRERHVRARAGRVEEVAGEEQVRRCRCLGNRQGVRPPWRARRRSGGRRRRFGDDDAGPDPRRRRDQQPVLDLPDLAGQPGRRGRAELRRAREDVVERDHELRVPRDEPHRVLLVPDFGDRQRPEVPP